MTRVDAVCGIPRKETSCPEGSVAVALQKSKICNGTSCYLLLPQTGDGCVLGVRIKEGRSRRGCDTEILFHVIYYTLGSRNSSQSPTWSCHVFDVLKKFKLLWIRKGMLYTTLWEAFKVTILSRLTLSSTHSKFELLWNAFTKLLFPWWRSMSLPQLGVVTFIYEMRQLGSRSI